MRAYHPAAAAILFTILAIYLAPRINTHLLAIAKGTMTATPAYVIEAKWHKGG